MAEPAETTDLSSVHTTSLPAILDRIGASVLVTTYQAGKLIAVRSDGGVANTHFRAFHTPMGLALDNGRLALGTKREVWTLEDMPAVGAKLDPPGKHDAVFVPRSLHYTGHIAGPGHLVGGDV